MNLRNLRDRIVSSMLAPGIVGSVVVLGAHSVSAQSITATTPFPFCVNNQAFPMGQYRLTLISPWLLSIRNVNGGGERLFQVHPEVGGPQGLASGQVGSVDGVTFSIFQGFRELKAVHEAGSDVNFELIGQGIPRDRLRTRGSLKPTSCFADGSSIRVRNATPMMRTGCSLKRSQCSASIAERWVDASLLDRGMLGIDFNRLLSKMPNTAGATAHSGPTVLRLIAAGVHFRSPDRQSGSTRRW